MGRDGPYTQKLLAPRRVKFYTPVRSKSGVYSAVNINLFLHKALSYAVAEGYIQSNPAASINLSRGNKPQIEILTRGEQLQLFQASYQHRYGVFIRLVLCFYRITTWGAPGASLGGSGRAIQHVAH